ncbi:MAG TPA: hypothetical protein ENI37_05335 [Chloroflexi bacterium]|nr:hypothetical protein [Chloroflexota bacterium]
MGGDISWIEVLWRDKRSGTNYDVYGQVVNTDGTLSGTDFAINTDAGDQRPKDLLYDPNANHFLAPPSPSATTLPNKPPSIWSSTPTLTSTWSSGGMSAMATGTSTVGA